MTRMVFAAAGALALMAVALPAGTALAQCPEDLQRLGTAIDDVAARQEQPLPADRVQALRQMQSEAERLHQSGNDEGCTTLVRQALAQIGEARMPQLALASGLRDIQLVNPQGERMGHISDIILDLGSGRVAFAIVSLGGVLGIGEDQFPVPWEAFQTVGNDRIVLPVERDRLKIAPRFDRNLWPGVATADWRAAMYSFYGLTPAWARVEGESGSAPGQAGTAGPLDQRMAGLSQQVADLRAQVQHLAGQVANGGQPSAAAQQNAERIRDLSDRVAALQNQVGGIDPQALGAQITSLQDELDRLRQQMQAQAAAAAPAGTPAGTAEPPPNPAPASPPSGPSADDAAPAPAEAPAQGQ